MTKYIFVTGGDVSGSGKGINICRLCRRLFLYQKNNNFSKISGRYMECPLIRSLRERL